MNKFIDFTLKSSEGKEITLSHILQDHKVWLMFYRGTF